MILISHRGNLDGPNPHRDNNLQAILECIELGYDVEIDLWYQNGTFWLGHDKPQETVSFDILSQHADKLWCHAKNYDALYSLLTYPKFNVFSHDVDAYAITSKGYIWTINHAIGLKTVLMIPNDLLENAKPFVGKKQVYGICSDYISHFKEAL